MFILFTSSYNIILRWMFWSTNAMSNNVINMLFRHDDIFDLWITRLKDKNIAAIHCCDLVDINERYNHLYELCCINIERGESTDVLEDEIEDICMEALVKSIVQLSDNAFLDELLQTEHAEYALQFVTKH